MKDKKILAEKLAKYNTTDFNYLKASEELQELSLILTQKLTKEDAVSDQSIIDEIGDVELRLEVLKTMFNKSKIKERLKHKISKCNDYLLTGKYKNI